MKLNFRQGIWKARTASTLPDFLEYAPSNNTITIDITDTPLVINMIFRTKNYLVDFRETKIDAWGPLDWNAAWGIAPNVPSYWLYWNINIASGMVSQGFTPYEPIYAYTEPVNPEIDQHWFDLNQNIFFVWDGRFWRPNCRLFAGFWDGTITPQPFGSQIGLTVGSTLMEPVDAGYILYGMDMKGIRDHDASFVTTAQPLRNYHGSFTSDVRLELASSTFIADEPIPMFYAVTNNGDGTISLGSGNDNARVPIGVAYQDAAIGESVDIITHGIVYNDQWTWDVAEGGKDLYCDHTGELIQIPEAVGYQKIGTILDTRYVLIDVDPKGGGLGGGSPGGPGPTGPTGPPGPGFYLEQDVPVIGTSVGAVDEGFVFLEGLSFTEFVILVSQRLLHPNYVAPTLSLAGDPAPQFFEIGTARPFTLSTTYAQNNAGALTGTVLNRDSNFLSNTLPYTTATIQLTGTPTVFQAQYFYSQGPCLVNNFGLVDCLGRIEAGSVLSNTVSYVGTRLAFFGTPTATPLTSDDVRALAETSFNTFNNPGVDENGVALIPAPVPNFTITIPIGADRVVFAYPASLRPVASVKYQELSYSEVKGNFIESSVTVGGANNYLPVTYRVYTYIPVEPYSILNHYQVFI